MIIPDDVVVKLKEDFQNGINCTKLQDKYGYNRKLISRILKENGHTVQRGYTKDIIRKAKKMHNDGLSIMQIAKALHVDRHQLSLKLSQLGVREQIEPKNKKQRFVETEETQKVTSDYQNGMSIKEIANSLGRSTNYVCRILNHYDMVETDRLTTVYHMN